MKKIIKTIGLLLVCVGFSSCSGILADLGLDEEDATEAFSENSYMEPGDEECEDSAECESDEALRQEVAGKTPLNGKKWLEREGRGEVNAAVESNDVIVGMSRQDVLRSWGQPSIREIAGVGKAGNERWTYGSKYDRRGSRFLIFENGRIIGWHR